jgi:hypothetical protein
MTRDELCLKASLLFDAGLGMCAARLDRPPFRAKSRGYTLNGGCSLNALGHSMPAGPLSHTQSQSIQTRSELPTHYRTNQLPWGSLYPHIRPGP